MREREGKGGRGQKEVDGSRGWTKVGYSWLCNLYGCFIEIFGQFTTISMFGEGGVRQLVESWGNFSEITLKNL